MDDQRDKLPSVPELLMPRASPHPVKSAPSATPDLPPQASKAPQATQASQASRAPPPSPASFGPASNRDIDFDEESHVAVELDASAPQMMSLHSSSSPGVLRSATGSILSVRAPSLRAKEALGPKKKRSSGVWFLALLVILAFAAVGAYQVPGYAKRRAIAAAARQGVLLSVERVTLRPSGVLLSGVRATSAELPAVTLGAAEIEIALEGIEPRGVVVRNFELALSGSVGEELAKIEAWRKAHAGADLLRVEARAGHVVWTDPFGHGTLLEAWDTSMQLAEASPRDELRLKAPSLMVRTSLGQLGPWTATLDRDAQSSRFDVALDPLAPDFATARLVRPTLGESTLDVTIPRTPLARLGLPPELFFGDNATQVEVNIASTSTPASSTDASAAISLYGARVAGRPPADLKLAAKASGDPRDALPLTGGTLSLGPLGGKLNGSLALLDESVRVELTWKPAGAPPCAPQKGSPPAAPVVLDTRDLAGFLAKPAPGACILGVYAAPALPTAPPAPRASSP